jgi:hypothetical protein
MQRRRSRPVPCRERKEAVLRIRNRWLGFCEVTVDEDLDRILQAPSDSAVPRAPGRESQWILLANSRRGSFGRNPGKLEPAGKADRRFHIPGANLQTVAYAADAAPGMMKMRWRCGGTRCTGHLRAPPPRTPFHSGGGGCRHQGGLFSEQYRLLREGRGGHTRTSWPDRSSFAFARRPSSVSPCQGCRPGELVGSRKKI